GVRGPAGREGPRRAARACRRSGARADADDRRQPVRPGCPAPAGGPAGRARRPGGRARLWSGHGDHRRLEPLPVVTGVNVPLMRRPPEWMDRAACVDSDPEAFFVAGESALAEAVEAEAKAVCRTCDVAAECWQYATERGERFGIWAGVNLEKERRRGIA